jgi:hypothetical protein
MFQPPQTMYQYGFLVLHNHAQAMQINQENGNTKWQDLEILELSQIGKYDSFIDKGKGYKEALTTRKLRSTSCMLSSMMDNTSQDLS